MIAGVWRFSDIVIRRRRWTIAPAPRFHAERRSVS
jgi:hypothetical protein